MQPEPLMLSPLPLDIDGAAIGGTLFERPPKCLRCRSMPCRTADLGRVDLCAFGYGFLRATTNITIVGVALRSFPISNEASRKVQRNAGLNSSVTVDQVEACSRAIVDWMGSEQEFFHEAREAQLASLRSDLSLSDLVEALDEKIRLSFGQVHDYRSFAIQIKQNVVRQLERRFPNLSLEEQLGRADHEITAIYWAAQLMIAKLEAIYFLQDRSSLQELGDYGKVRFHSLFLKYLRIYKYSFEEKRVSTLIRGSNNRDMFANSTALGLIAQGLIDNSLKYAPSKSQVVFTFDESPGELVFGVESYGPRIDEDETEAIFEPFYRGRHAQDVEGAGVGLALVGLAAEQVGSTIVVSQDSADSLGGLVRTRFEIVLDLTREG